LEIGSTIEHEWGNSKSIKIAVKATSPSDNKNGNNPGFIWLGGFKSDMEGTKAQAMVSYAAKLGCPSLRFDYSGHGASGGKFSEGTISRWVSESLAVFRAKTKGPQILVGSSMGAWIALRLAQQLKKIKEPERLAGLLLIAPAPDFTAELMEPAFSKAHIEELETKGYIEEPSEYSDEPNIITKALIEDGRENLVLGSDLSFSVPVRILQGMQDPDVPHAHALKLMEAMPHDNVTLTLVKDGDHRLSRDQDIALFQQAMAELVKEINSAKS